MNKSILFLCPLCFLFLPAFYIGSIPVYDIIIGISYILLFFFAKTKRNNSDYFKYKFFRILIYYIIWIIFSGIILFFTGKITFNNFLYGVFVQFFINNLMWYFYPSLIFPNKFPIKKLIHFLLIAIYLVCLYGLFEYFCFLTGIHISHGISNILVNRRLMEVVTTTRIRSFFDEPGYFGGFLCVNLPIIYSVILSHYKILKNKNFNIFFKKSYIPLIWISIILIQSPIWLLFSVFVSIIYFYKKFLNRQIIILIFVIICTLPFFLFIKNSIDIEKTFLKRIINVYETMSSPEVFVNREPSLWNRITSYNARFKLFLKYPVTGVGYKNTERNIYTIFLKSDLPLTNETINYMNDSIKTGYCLTNGAIFWNALSDTGIIGFVLFYAFVLLTIFKANHLKQYFPDCLEKTFLAGNIKSIIVIIFLSFYDLRSNFVYFWFLYGIVLSYVTQISNKRKINMEIQA